MMSQLAAVESLGGGGHNILCILYVKHNIRAYNEFAAGGGGVFGPLLGGGGPDIRCKLYYIILYYIILY